jgi:hypothetical protein
VWRNSSAGIFDDRPAPRRARSENFLARIGAVAALVPARVASDLHEVLREIGAMPEWPTCFVGEGSPAH